jgi:hypothetical protein
MLFIVFFPGNARFCFGDSFFCTLVTLWCVADVGGVLWNTEVKEDEMVRACSMQGEKRNICISFVEKPEGKRPIGRIRCS